MTDFQPGVVSRIPDHVEIILFLQCFVIGKVVSRCAREQLDSIRSCCCALNNQNLSYFSSSKCDGPVSRSTVRINLQE
ncbi:MAG: hypothetical protein J4G05_10485 [Chlorobi bacterium]|nr:hypothetical protein [Chlorobiota bacterium]